MVEMKFCGMTRAADAREAAFLGARYVGVILTGSPRQVTDAEAGIVFAPVPESVKRVGVFGADLPEEIAARAKGLRLDIVQLHGDPDAAVIARVREHWTGQVWAVQRLRGTDVPGLATELFAVADAVVLDARVAGQLGGTGVALPWKDLRDRVHSLRAGRARLVLAGGLTPDNVGTAIRLLEPDIVDVSSGIERGVGVKDHATMRAFRDAVYTVQPR
ncbi:MAG: phosphoribosylanthranilate isomerase [Gemmatimonadaceae bacterium]